MQIHLDGSENVFLEKKIKWPFDSFGILRPNVCVRSCACAAFARTCVWLMLHPPVLCFVLFFARSMWRCCAVLSCTRTTLTPTHPPTQTCLGTHIDCSVPSEHMHAETPTRSSYEPSHLMFMHQPQSRLGKLLRGDHFKSPASVRG